MDALSTQEDAPTTLFARAYVPAPGADDALDADESTAAALRAYRDARRARDAEPRIVALPADEAPMLHVYLLVTLTSLAVAILAGRAVVVCVELALAGMR